MPVSDSGQSEHGLHTGGKLGGTTAVLHTGGLQFASEKAVLEKALGAKFAPESVPAGTVKADTLNSDLHGSAEYRAHLITVMAKRAVEQALGK